MVKVGRFDPVRGGPEILEERTSLTSRLARLYHYLRPTDQLTGKGNVVKHSIVANDSLRFFNGGVPDCGFGRANTASRPNRAQSTNRAQLPDRAQLPGIGAPLDRGKGGRVGLLWLCLIGFFGSCLDPAPKRASAEVDAASVQRAIDRGVTHLRKSQTERGGWQEYGGQSCGLSSLCTLALLNCGVEKDDPAMVRSLRYLRSFEPKETYSVSLQTLVFCKLGAAVDLPRLRRNVQWLVSQQKSAGDRVGAWDYGGNRSIGSGDPSNTQFALLALGAAKDRGIEVDSTAFERSLNYWTSRQRGGGWTYGSGQRVSGSMTCAGIASVIISRERLEGGSAAIVKDQIRCCGAREVGPDPVEAGIEWLGRNFSLQVNPGGSSMTFYYYLYALERVGRLSGRRFIGDHDWYREGAERLLQLQDGFQGFWSGAGQMAEANQDVATSFALLFLSKGKRQVVIGRLKYPGQQPQSQSWQRHPDSLRQLVRHVERDWGRDLTWQTIDSEQASLVDLLQAPVLIISGRESLRFSDELLDRLKQYADQGGCILFEADGGDGCGDAAPFERSVRKICERWYPGAPLARLPPTHPIWFAQRNVDPASLGANFWVYGVQACCRTAVFYVPKTLSCRWQLSDLLFQRGQESPAARQQIDAAVRLGENVIAYATGRELKDKLEQRVVIQRTGQIDSSRGVIRIAVLDLDAGGNDASRALPNAVAIIGQQVPIAITTPVEPIGLDSDQLKDVQLLWIHGRTDFSFDAQQRKLLGDFVRDGGMVLGTAICGSEPFGDAFRREISRILPESPLRSMQPGHPALTNTFGGFDVTSVTIRTPASHGSENAMGQRIAAPVLDVAVVGDIASVFFSPLDISCALESQNSVQCPGYSTEDAAKIVANLLLFGLQQ